MFNFHSNIYKKSSLLFCFFLLPIMLFAQSSDLDEDFLNSLPEEVQDELASENTEAKPLDKLLNSKTSVLKNKEALKIIKQQISALENRMSDGDNNNLSPSLNRFGESFFSSMQSTFMPINVPNLDGDYILGVGDKLSLNIVGNNPSFYESIIIDRDGSISLEEYGKVFLAGKNFSQAERTVKNFIQNRLIGGEVYLSLKELRDIQVIILGGAVNPGIYTISGGSNLLHALNVSGGISNNGSYRNIRISRANKVVKRLDLYDTLVFGDTKLFDFNLRSGDTIFIEPLEFSVPISGGINTPGIYDILLGESLDDLLKFSGGFNQDSFNISTIFLERDGNSSSELIEIQKENIQSIILQPRDSVVVPEYAKELIPSRTVTISGAVRRPGKYSIEDNDTLLDLIERVGGYKKNAYEYGGIFYRKSIEDISSTFSKRIYSDTINFLVSNLGQGSGGSNSQPLTGDFLKILIEEFQSSDSIKRIITEFDAEKLKSNPLINIRLEDKDVIEIPEVPQHVFLFGDFNQQVILPYDPSYQISDYIALAAGKKSSATKHIILIDPNGLSYYFEQARFDLFKDNPDIYPGSIIYLPRELGKVEGIMFAAAVAPILSSLTLSLASINAIQSD